MSDMEWLLIAAGNWNGDAHIELTESMIEAGAMVEAGGEPIGRELARTVFIAMLDAYEYSERES